MKKRFRLSPLGLAFVAMTSLSMIAASQAADFYWDANGATGGTGGNGNWGTANTWRDGSATGTLGNWVDGNTAVFGGTVGTITLNQNVALLGITSTLTASGGMKIAGSGANELDFGTDGTSLISSPSGGLQISAKLKGAVTMRPTNGNVGNATSAFVKADNTGLTSFTLAAATDTGNIIIDHAGALGPVTMTAKLQTGILGLGALSTEAIAAAAANGTGGGMVIQTPIELAGAYIRGRAGVNTLAGPINLTANSGLMLRPAAGVQVIVDGTVNLGSNTLSIATAAVANGIRINGAVSGTGGITTGNYGGGAGLDGTGVLTLAGTNIYTGPTTVNLGRLNLPGSLTSDVSLASGTQLSGEGSTTGGLTFGGTHTLSFDPSTPAALTAGSVNASAATITLSLANTAPAATGLVILDAPGGITGTVGVNFLFTGRGNVYLNGTATQLLFDYTPATLTWRGNASPDATLWDVNATTNWVNGAAPDKFLTSDSVVFDDTASSFIVNATGTGVQPGSMVFNNTANAYILQGVPVGGIASLTKNGTGSVVLASNNTYTGGTTINAGTLQLGDGLNATGQAGTGAIALQPGATLIAHFGANAVALPNATSGGGSFRQSGSGILSVTGAMAHTGPTLIDAGATLQLGNNTFSGSLAGPIQNDGVLQFYRQDAVTVSNVISGAGEIRKAQGNAVNLTGNNTFTGPATLTGGVMILANNAALGATDNGLSISGGRVILENGITISGETLSLTGAGGDFNGGLQAIAGGSATWAGDVLLNFDARLGTGIGGTLTVSGGIHDGTAGNLFIGAGLLGTGTVVIATPAGQSTYTGSTTMARGTLKLGATNALPVTTVVDVDFSNAAENAVFDLNGFSQTIAGLRRTNTGGGTGLAIVTNSTATASVLTLNQQDFTTFSGSLTGNLSVVKSGTGEILTTGRNSYTGNTSILAGTLGFAARDLPDTGTLTIADGAVAALNFSGADRVGSLVINNVTLPDGLYNSTSQGGIYAAYFTGIGSIRVGIGGYDLWVSGYPELTGADALPEADPDMDGLTNLMESVLGGNPLPTGPQPSVLPVTGRTEAGDLLLTFNRLDASEEDTVLQLQASTTLETWPANTVVTLGPEGDESGALPGGVMYSVTENGAGPDVIIVTVPAALAERNFVRIRAVR